MLIAFGALTGLLGFAPIFLSFRIARLHPSTNVMSLGLYGLAGVAVSLVVLIAGLLVCAFTARDGLIGFVIAEAVVFLGATIIFVVRKNAVFKRERSE